MEAFKAYDIRGVWGKDLNEEIVFKIACFLPEQLGAKKILVGRDVRISSPVIFQALTAGLIDAGAHVFDAGITTTPMIYWATGRYNFDASVMITASHNPKEYNGLKVSANKVKPIGYADGLGEIEQKITNNLPCIKKSGGQIQTFNVKESYSEFLKSYSDFGNNLNISIDYSNGMAALFANELFASANAINHFPNGEFPAHEPNPLETENRKQIVNEVIKNSSDVGIIFDGDADRVMFIDENGNFVSPDLIIALLGNYFLKNNKAETVVQDIRTSKAVAEYLSRFDAKVEIWKVGRAFGASKLKELNGIYGGELAGHYYFRDFYYSDSGLLAAILVLNIVSDFNKKGIKFSELVNEISPYFNTGEVNFKIEDKLGAMNKVRDYFFKSEKPNRYLDFDGYRLDFDDWWFNIRPSNTEPYLRFLAEAKSAEMLKEKTEIIYSILNEFEK